MQIFIRRSKKAKNMRISIYPDKRVVVTAPINASEKLIHAFVQAKLTWIKRQLNKITTPKLRLGRIESGQQFTQQQISEYKRQAEILILQKLRYYNQHYKLLWHQVSVKNQKTRWGSCSKSGNLNFNFRIMFLPIELTDYVIVHELCHLAQFSHSTKFWQLVEQTTPHWKLLRKQLHNYSLE